MEMVPIRSGGMFKNMFAISNKFPKELVIANPKIVGTLTNVRQLAVPFEKNVLQKKMYI